MVPSIQRCTPVSKEGADSLQMIRPYHGTQRFIRIGVVEVDEQPGRYPPDAGQSSAYDTELANVCAGLGCGY